MMNQEEIVKSLRTKLKESREEIDKLRLMLKRGGECRETMQGIIDRLREELNCKENKS